MLSNSVEGGQAVQEKMDIEFSCMQTSESHCDISPKENESISTFVSLPISMKISVSVSISMLVSVSVSISPKEGV